jgi:hydroxymethylbilane synthase
LARAQSSAVARRLEQLHSGLRVELVGIDTRGDRITSTPLSQVDGKEFFTAEIDAALRAGDVDLTVHSYKDLSLERPADLHLGAVPARENPRDIVYFAADVPERLASGATLRIGSSSPRRQAFVPSFLERALPNAPRVELCELRGNVDTRLRRLREPRGSERQLDGVILAFAGLSRLWQDEAVGAAVLLHELLAGLPRMLLPLTLCPTAPAQGALAIECRSADLETRALLAAIDDPATRAGIGVERALLAGAAAAISASARRGCRSMDWARCSTCAGRRTRPNGLWCAGRRPRARAAPALGWGRQPAPALEPLPGSRPSGAAARRGKATFIATAVRCPSCRPPPWSLPAPLGVRHRAGCAGRAWRLGGGLRRAWAGALRATLASPLLARRCAVARAHEPGNRRGLDRVPVLATYRHVSDSGGAGAAVRPVPSSDNCGGWRREFERGVRRRRAAVSMPAGQQDRRCAAPPGVRGLTVFPLGAALAGVVAT